MEQQDSKTRFVICIKNEGYPASLELLKIYRVVLDDRAVEHRLVRVVDESGEDYIYPVDNFVPIELPRAVEEAVALVSAVG